MWRDAEGRRHVVADHDAGDVELLLGLLDHVVDVAGADRVLAGRRLVVDHDLGPHDDGAGQADALLLALGDLARHAVGDVGDVQALEDLVDPLADHLLAGGSVALLEREGDVAGDRQPVEQRRVLEEEPEARAHLVELALVVMRDDVLAEHPDLAARRA